MSVSSSPFGKSDGKEATLFTLRNDKLTVKITNYGGILTEILAPDRKGNFANICLGFDSLERYLQGHPYFGALIGRVANRIAGGKFTIDGQEYHTLLNNPVKKPVSTLHGGKVGFDKKIWDAKVDGDSLILSLTSPDGEEGFPGTLKIVVTYTLSGDTLKIDYKANTDKPTVINLTNHCYMNLAGAGNGNVKNHQLVIHADSRTVADANLLTTGEICSVIGTPYDFTTPHTIGERFAKTPCGYDDNFCLRSQDESLAPAARVVEPNSGRVLEVSTTQPGVQLYTGNFLEENGLIHGLGGTYVNQGGFCLETQHYPNSTSHPHFPSTILRPGENYHQVTTMRFTTES